MDAEIPELGPGAQPADRPVRGTAHRIPVKKIGMAENQNPCHPSLISSAFILLPENPSLIPEPTENGNKIQCLFACNKIRKRNKPLPNGYTINRRTNSKAQKT